MPRRRLLVLGLLLPAAFAAGCGSENTALIPQDRAAELTASVDRIASACRDEDAGKARAAAEAANQQVSELPRRVDAKLKRNLRDWIGHLEDRIPDDCKAEPEETPTPTETATPTPSETATPSPTATVEPPGNGGVPAPEDANP